MQDYAALATVLNIVFTPLIVLLTMWAKNKFATSQRAETRFDKQQESLLAAISDRVSACERRHADRDREMREIKHELKNRDIEYIKLYQDYTTLKAKYEVLNNDHNQLKNDFDLAATEIATLKEDLQRAATKIPETK